MALMAWSEAYGVGHAMLDADHRILINLVNQLHDAMETGQSRAVVGTVINVLAEYTEHHFRREEAILTAAGFPLLEQHKAEHSNLEARVRDIRDRWSGGERQVLDQEVLDFIKKWLTDHILGADKSYGAWVGT
jgi:hemerythrin-like metal-binding domain